jgi:hypothetical protein
MKKYKFAFKSIEDKNQLIPGHSVAFSSYPGVITSLDDYYILSSGLVVQETSIANFNKSLRENILSYAVVLELLLPTIWPNLAKNGLIFLVYIMAGLIITSIR